MFANALFQSVSSGSFFLCFPLAVFFSVRKWLSSLFFCSTNRTEKSGIWGCSLVRQWCYFLSGFFSTGISLWPAIPHFPGSAFEQVSSHVSTACGDSGGSLERRESNGLACSAQAAVSQLVCLRKQVQLSNHCPSHGQTPVPAQALSQQVQSSRWSEWVCHLGSTFVKELRVTALASERAWIVTIHEQHVLLSIAGQCCFFQAMLGKCSRANAVSEPWGNKWLLMQFLSLRRAWKAKADWDLE